MTLHYHGTPITPLEALYEMSGCCFCVSHSRPDDIERVHKIGQSVMLDNGAFSAWTKCRAPDWYAYYDWSYRWLECPTTWAVIPDVIDGSEDQQDELIKQWPHRTAGAPVWHMNESIERLERLTDFWPKVCIGSTARYAVVMSDSWQRRMDEAWNAISHYRTPWVHMLRGMQCAGERWPFASLDSTDIARNHKRQQNTPPSMVKRWDRVQCPTGWFQRTIEEDTPLLREIMLER